MWARLAGCVHSTDQTMAQGLCISVAFLVGVLFRGAAADGDSENKVCAEGLVCEDECCSGFNMVMPYCCSKNEGYIYLGMMIGSGVITALMILGCYRIMQRSERELQAAARLEEAKAANRVYNNLSWTSSDGSSSALPDGGEQAGSNQAPPAYNEVVGNLARCHSCDLQTDRSLGLGSDGAHVCFETGSGGFHSSNIFARQFSDGALTLSEQQNPNQGYRHLVQEQQLYSQSAGGLPAVVNINQMLSQQGLEHFTPAAPELQTSPSHRECSDLWLSQPVVHQMLPPPVSEADQWNKLPTYEEYCNTPSRLSHSATEVVRHQNNLKEQNSQRTEQTNTETSVSGSETSSLRRPMEVGHATMPSEFHLSSSKESVVSKSSYESASTDGEHIQASLNDSADAEPKEHQGRVRHALVKLPSIQESDEEDEMTQCGERIKEDSYTSQSVSSQNTHSSVSESACHNADSSIVDDACQTNDNAASESLCTSTENRFGICEDEESQNTEDTKSLDRDEDNTYASTDVDQVKGNDNGLNQSQDHTSVVCREKSDDRNTEQANNLISQGVYSLDESEPDKQEVDVSEQAKDLDQTDQQSQESQNDHEVEKSPENEGGNRPEECPEKVDIDVSSKEHGKREGNVGKQDEIDTTAENVERTTKASATLELKAVNKKEN